MQRFGILGQCTGVNRCDTVVTDFEDLPFPILIAGFIFQLEMEVGIRKLEEREPQNWKLGAWKPGKLDGMWNGKFSSAPRRCPSSLYVHDMRDMNTFS